MITLRPARGASLTAIGEYYGFTRHWFERLPFFGDRWFRNRLLHTLRPNRRWPANRRPAGFSGWAILP